MRKMYEELETKEGLTLGQILEDIGFGKFHIYLVIVLGWMQSFEAIEILILALLQSKLRCEWQTTLWQDTLLMTSVYVGMMIGSPTLGGLSDMYGRKRVLSVCIISAAYFGLVSAASPSIIWITTIRTLMGASLEGALMSIATLSTELTPTSSRANVFFVVCLFWSFGSYVVTVLWIIIVPIFGWRAFLALSILPLVVILPCLLWLPESPRFLLLKNRKEEAVGVLTRMAKMHGRERVTDVSQPPHNRHSFSDIFHSKYLSTVLINSILWFVSGLTYYGIVLMAVVIDSSPRQCLQIFGRFSPPSSYSNSSVDDSCCETITWSNYSNMFISISGEVLFLPLSLIMINTIGRKYSMVIFSLTLAILFVVLNMCMHSIAMNAVLFVIRGSICSTFNINYIYTSEVFPTSVRSFGFGLSNMSAKVGAILSPLIVNFVLMGSSFLIGTMIFATLNLVAFVVTLMLPYETRNKPLFQTAEEFSMDEPTKS